MQSRTKCLNAIEKKKKREKEKRSDPEASRQGGGFSVK